MAVQNTMIERSFNELHSSCTSSTISLSWIQQNTSDQNMDEKQSNMISKLWKRFNSCRKSYILAVCVFVIYTILVTTVGVLIVCFDTPKSNETCQLDFKRTMKSSIVSSSKPRSVAVGDFNNDQHIDIVVANSDTNTIGIFLSTGNQTFADQQTYSTGSESRPYSVVVSDFNHDNCLDIAVANYGIHSIGIFLGNGNGTFNDQKICSLDSSRPLFVSTGDFNRDNRMDIAIVNYGTNSVSILLGYGNGSFQDQKSYSTGYDSIPYALAVGDFNNDDQLDISVANYGTNNIGILLGNGNGTFLNQQIYTTLPKSNPTSIAVGDFNHDNQLDIAVSNNGTGSVGIFFGYGNGTFQAQINYSTGSNSYPQYISVGDLDDDNALDIIVVDSQNDQIHILPGYGDGSFPTITTYDVISGSHPVSVVMADFNNNRSGIAVANDDSNNVLVLIDYSIKPSARQTNYDIMSWYNTVSVAVSDFNNDHILDVVYFTTSYVHIRMGLGNGLFGSENTYSIGYVFAPQYICVGDLNNDNQMDIVTANVASDNVGVVLGRGDGTFDNMTTHSSGIGSSPWWTALGDVNNDNRLDIISANTGSNTIGILLGNGDGTFAAVVTFSTVVGSAPHSVAVGDLNNDKQLDLVVANNNDFVIVFLGHGNGTFIFVDAYTTNGSSDPTSIAVADFNSDNYLDVVVANTFTNNIGVFLGYGNGTLSAQTSYSTGAASNPYYVIVADINNNNISDIVVTNFGSDEVIIFYGYGNGSFALTRRFSTGFGSNPYGITTTSFDNNKQLELVVALSGSGCIAILIEYNAAEFVNQINYFTGSAPQPLSVAIGDFNNDNRPDIVVANSGTDNLAILINLNNGMFDTEINYPIGTGSSPHYVITCDINKDNQLDLVSVNSKMNSISVIEGYGNGSFADQKIYSTGNNSHPYAVASGDLNNDNRVDLVTANEGTDSISIFFGFNYTLFQKQRTYWSVDSLAASDIAVSDFNNDHSLDIAATFYWSNKIGILLGYGNGNFTDIITYSTGDSSGPWGIAAGDFNNDNQPDIVVTNSVTNTIGVFLGYGNGSFTTITTYSTGEYSAPQSIAINDFNNDSRLDVVVANYGTNSVGVLLGYGNGTFSTVTIYLTGEDSSSSSVTVGDFNNDGYLDIAVANYGTNSVGVLLGYGDGTFGNQMTFSTGLFSRPIWVIVGDFNNDTILDIATANWNAANVGILIGYGNGTFASIRTSSTGAGSIPMYVAVSDFNYDNILDIAVVNDATNNIVILFGFGDGSFLLGTAYSTGAESQPFALAIGDFNNDTRLDVAVANNFANNIGVFLGSGSQPYASAITYSIGDGSQPYSVAISDLNNDGYSDIIIANYGTDNVGILLGYGNKTFKTMKKSSTGLGSAPSSVAVANLNNDTHLDIIVSNSQTDNIAILFGYGNGTFATAKTYSTGTRSQPYTVVISDFNNDNISDIAVANSGTNNILLLYGRGDGTFGNETSYSLGYDYRPYSIAVKDLNQDNRTDIAIACYNTDHAETLIKMC